MTVIQLAEVTCAVAAGIAAAGGLLAIAVLITATVRAVHRLQRLVQSRQRCPVPGCYCRTDRPRRRRRRGPDGTLTMRRPRLRVVHRNGRPA